MNLFSHIPFLVVLALLLLVVYGMKSFFVIYHLIRFGIGPVPKLFAMIFFVGSMGLVVLTLVLFAQIDVTTVLQAHWSDILKTFSPWPVRPFPQ